MSPLLSLSRILVSRQVNARTISLTKFLQVREIIKSPEERNEDEDKKLDYVYDFDPADRTEVIDVETSIRYLESEAFKKTYGNKPVWVLYRRNLTGHKFRDTRRSCIVSNKVWTASPCPICRDKYLVPDYTNIKLLKHFISPHYGELLPTMLTGVCQKQQKNLRIAFLKAKEYGTISFDVPVRFYDYKYYQELSKKNTAK